MSNLPTSPIIVEADPNVEGTGSGMNGGSSDSAIGICTSEPNPKETDWDRTVKGATVNPIGQGVGLQYLTQYEAGVFDEVPVGFAPADTQAAPGEVYATNAGGFGWDLINKTVNYTTEIGDWLWGVASGATPAKVLFGDSNRRVEVPLIQTGVNEDFSIKFTWRRELSADGSGGAVFLVNRDNAQPQIYASDGGALIVRGDTEGTTGYSGLVNTPIGTEVIIEMRVTGGFNQFVTVLLDNVLQPTTTSWTGIISVRALYGVADAPTRGVPVESYIKDFVFENIASGEKWKYSINEGAGTTILCLDENDAPKPLSNGTAIPDASWGQPT